MLDQNTDRMWYVIGAVLIGAAIIFGMNTMFPTAFASVTENFEKASDNVARMVEDISGESTSQNLFVLEHVSSLGIGSYGIESADTTNIYVGSSGVRGYHLPVNAGEVYRIKRSDKRNTRFGYGFTKEEPAKDVTVYNINRSYQDALMIDEIVVPDGMAYLFLYLNNWSAHESDVPNITIEQIR